MVRSAVRRDGHDQPDLAGLLADSPVRDVRGVDLGGLLPDTPGPVGASVRRWATGSGAGKLRGRATGKTTPVPGRKVVDGLVLGVLIVLVGAQVVVGVPAGIRDAGLWHQRQLVTADVTANLDQVPTASSRTNWVSGHPGSCAR